MARSTCIIPRIKKTILDIHTYWSATPTVMNSMLNLVSESQGSFARFLLEACHSEYLATKAFKKSPGRSCSWLIADNYPGWALSWHSLAARSMWIWFKLGLCTHKTLVILRIRNHPRLWVLIALTHNLFLKTHCCCSNPVDTWSTDIAETSHPSQIKTKLLWPPMGPFCSRAAVLCHFSFGSNAAGMGQILVPGWASQTEAPHTGCEKWFGCVPVQPGYAGSQPCSQLGQSARYSMYDLFLVPSPYWSLGCKPVPVLHTKLQDALAYSAWRDKRRTDLLIHIHFKKYIHMHSDRSCIAKQFLSNLNVCCLLWALQRYFSS